MHAFYVGKSDLLGYIHKLHYNQFALSGDDPSFKSWTECLYRMPKDVGYQLTDALLVARTCPMDVLKNFHVPRSNLQVTLFYCVYSLCKIFEFVWVSIA